MTILSLFGVPVAILDALSYDNGPFEAVGLLGLVCFLGRALLTGVRLYLGQRAAGRNVAVTQPPLRSPNRL